MELNYIILAHKNPLQLKRLIERLSGPKTNFFIQIDKNVEIEIFEDCVNKYSEIYFLNNSQREPGIWGDIGIVKATFHALKQIIKDKRSGYCILLSGLDYPLKSNKFIKEFLLKDNGTQYINLFPLPTPFWQENGMDRILKYKINYSNKRYHFFKIPSIYSKEFYQIKTLMCLKHLVKKGKIKDVATIFKKRRFPKNLLPFGGSQWWALTVPVVKQILQYKEQNPNYLKYHKYTLLPDETFFHSILMELNKNNSFKTYPSLTYVHWDEKRAPLPVTFNMNDLEELRIASKKCLFARKFDCNKDEMILNKIDEGLIEFY